MSLQLIIIFEKNVAVGNEDMYIMVNRTRQMRKIATGVKFVVLCKDRNKLLIILNNLKESNPVEVDEYTRARKIDTEPIFSWWVPYTLKKKEMVIDVVKTRLKANPSKFGIEVLRNITHAQSLDKEDGNIL